MNAILEVLTNTYQGFLLATFLTLKLTISSLLIAVLIGLIFAFMKISKNKISNKIADLYIAIIRGTPLIVQIMFLYYGITSIVVLSDFWAGSLALAIHSGAYIAEILRGTIQSIDKGQMEAAKSLGMKNTLAMRRIILPQAFKRAIPPLGNQFIIGLKDSSLVALIGVQEIYSTALSEQAANFMPFETYIVAGLYYLVLVLIFTYLVNQLEKKLKYTSS
ncbi:amino acid ABC transporter permease [Tepidibacillus marianensis]|uniref:amino acid ABC transporter permease n=1 Tax=Tepidibacillus marianensis TaxID=3131995 RepID=UPI00386D6BB3